MTSSAEQARPAGRRGPAPRLRLEEVLQAGMRLIDTEGLDALTIRRLAAELGIGTMTLYGYVRTKEELFDRVLALVLGKLYVDVDPLATPDQQLRTAIGEVRRAAQEHPALLDLIVTYGAPGPLLHPVREQLLRILNAAGLGPRAALDAFAILLSYTLGFSMSERAQVATVAYPQDLEHLSPEEYPNLAAVAPFYGEQISQHTFEQGLHHLIAALLPPHR